MSLTLEQIAQHKIVPVVVVNDAKNADGLADAMVAGGMPVAEITFRTAAAADAIRAMANRSDLIVGAGTVRSVAQVEEAAEAGATFIVSPGLSEAVVRHAQELGLPVLPGCATPTEIMAAQGLGLDTVKFFPANVYGGAPAIKSLAAPFTDVKFIPTGGVSPKNLADFLALPCVPAVGGSWMVPAQAVDNQEFDKIEQLCREAARLVAEFTGGAE